MFMLQSLLVIVVCIRVSTSPAHVFNIFLCLQLGDVLCDACITEKKQRFHKRLKNDQSEIDIKLHQEAPPWLELLAPSNTKKMSKRQLLYALDKVSSECLYFLLSRCPDDMDAMDVSDGKNAGEHEVPCAVEKMLLSYEQRRCVCVYDVYKCDNQLG
jgi:hypothetical protein